MTVSDLFSDSASSRSFRELNIIIRISQSIIGTLDYQKVLQIISDGMAELLDIESAAIYMLEEEDQLLLSATTPPLDPGMPDFLRRATLPDHPHIQKAISERKPQLLADTLSADLSPAERNIVEMRQLRSLLYFPFVGEQRVSGVLILGTCNKQKTFEEHDVELGQTLANQLAIAIENSRLHQDLNNYKDNLEKLVAERTYDLETANEELVTINEELHATNELVSQQKEELNSTLNNLKAVQVRLIQAEKMASLGILTAGVAHEINNPLNFIMGAYLGLDDFFSTSLPEYKNEVAVLLNGLKTGLSRASEIVSGLNQFSRDSKVYNEECHVALILDNCLVMLHNQFKHRVVVEKNYLDHEVIVRGNVGKMHQAFTNILLNASQAIAEKGRVTISMQETDKELQIRITDTGCGIPEENLSRITDPFFTTKDPGEGTGLGLSITFNIIQEHRGSLEFESEPGKGTTVIVTLPVGQPA
ncbi:MAG: GAF domain-containing sensor histidine kinase [Bacteroidota bacterium]